MRTLISLQCKQVLEYRINELEEKIEMKVNQEEVYKAVVKRGN